MPVGKLPASLLTLQQGYNYIWYPGLGLVTHFIGVCDVTTTAATVFDVKWRSGQKDRADGTGLTIPIGAHLHRIALRLPPTTEGGTATGLVATNGDRLKLANAVSAATGSAAFAVDGTNTCVATAVAASSTFTEQQVKFEVVSPFFTATVPALTSAVTLRVYNDNGTTGAGSGVSVASGTYPIIVEACWFQTSDVPTLAQAGARIATVAVTAT